MLKLYLVITVLLIFSAVFLADALRRFNRSFSKDNRLVVNQKTMCLHIAALFIHTFFIIVAQYITYYTFMNANSRNSDILNISRICLFASQSLSQAIVIYLFIKFSKPVSFSKKNKDESESDEDFEDSLDRDPNLDMMYYVKNMPTM